MTFNSTRVRSVVILLLMLLAAFAASAWRPSQNLIDTRPRVDLEDLFPKQFAGWIVDDRMPVQLVSPDQAAVLTKIYSQTLSRTYVNRQGYRIMLSVAYGGDQSDATRAHRPEVCYPAQGFQLMDQRRDTLSIGSHQVPVRQLVTKMGGRVEPVTYWVMVGERAATSGTEQKLAQLAYTTRGYVPDGMLVRVSSIDAQSDVAFTAQQQFLTDMEAEFSAGYKSRVFGR